MRSFNPMSTTSTTLYQPLAGESAVRFIKLLPGKPSDQLSVEFSYDTLAISPAPIYEATSYTWGSPTPTETMLCNGHAFELRENAHGFLQQLRRPDETRLLWMDCICINQGDNDERADQVKIMHLIYRSAKRVVIWLGPQDGQSLAAMKFIAKLDPEPSIKEVEYYSFGGPFEAKSYIFDKMPESADNKRLVSALAGLLSRPWFRRVWIQQEAVLCRDTIVTCGPDEVSWDRLMSIAWLLSPRDSNGWPAWTGSGFQTVEPSLLALRIIQSSRISHLRVQNPWALAMATGLDPEAFWTDMEVQVHTEASHAGPGVFLGIPYMKLARDCSWCQATDPRDKVYALYNLDRSTTSRHASKRPKIDYTVPWQTVYIRTAKWMYDSFPVETLAMAGRSQQDGVNIPSWVPDLRISIDNAFVPHLSWCAGGLAYRPDFKFLSLPRSRPGPHSIPTYSYKNDKDQQKRIPNEALELTAILQDKIVYSSPKFTTASESLADNISPILLRLGSDLAFINRNLPNYFTGESGTEAYAGTIIANTTHDDKLAKADYERQGFAAWHAWLNGGFPDPTPMYHDAVDNAEMWTKNRFCVTGHGLMCLAPAMATDGDYVAILNGFRYPVALRKVGSPDEQYYELLGACYIHRLMRGRAWSLIEEWKCKYRSGSEDDRPGSSGDSGEGVCESFPFNAKGDYRHVVRVLGKRRIVLV